MERGYNQNLGINSGVVVIQDSQGLGNLMWRAYMIVWSEFILMLIMIQGSTSEFFMDSLQVFGSVAGLVN